MRKWTLWLTLGVTVLHLVSDGEATIRLAKRLRIL